MTRRKRARERRTWNRDRRYVRQRFGGRWSRWEHGAGICEGSGV